MTSHKVVTQRRISFLGAFCTKQNPRGTWDGWHFFWEALDGFLVNGAHSVIGLVAVLLCNMYRDTCRKHFFLCISHSGSQ